MRKKRFKDILLFTILFFSGIAIGFNIKDSMETEYVNTYIASDTSEVQEVVEKMSDSIAIPGYEGLTLKANSFEQDVALGNPSQNCCYFVITLYLKDGTKLWQSDYIAPGKNSEPIKLNHTLDVGVYSDAVLKYSCYSLENKSLLNGTETKLSLWIN